MATTLVMGLVPNLGYIQMPTTSVTLVHVPVLIGIMLLPLGYAIGLGLTFGLSSLVASYLQGSTITDLAFHNPLVSVLPRILFALIAYFIFHGIKLMIRKYKYGNVVAFGIVSFVTLFSIIIGLKYVANEFELPVDLFLFLGVLISAVIIALFFLAHKNDNQQFSSVTSAVLLSTVVHTLLVLGALAVFKVEAFGDEKVLPIIFATMMTNGIIEAVVAGIIVTPIYIAISKRFPELIERDLQRETDKRKLEENDSII